MYKLLLVLSICGLGCMLQAQTKKTPVKSAKTPTVEAAVLDSTSDIEVEPARPQDFSVYTKRYKIKKPAMRLCINLLNGDSIFNFCFIDSLLRDPEKTKLLFQKRDADSTFAMVYAMAFTKDPNRPECSAGRESKMYFARISNTTNKGVVKFRYIESCYKTITRLSREPIEDWDGSAPLKFSYNRGSKFYDLLFDPQNYKLGMQSPKDGEDK